MASLRARKRKDGSEYFAVLYRLQGKQTSTSFDDFESALRFWELATKFGPRKCPLHADGRYDAGRRCPSSNTSLSTSTT